LEFSSARQQLAVRFIGTRFYSRQMSVGFLHWGWYHKYAFALTQRGKERSDLPTNNVRSSNAVYKKGRGAAGCSYLICNFAGV
jgi:hypothetical protein